MTPPETCPHCGAIKKFEFSKTVEWKCGSWMNLENGKFNKVDRYCDLYAKDRQIERLTAALSSPETLARKFHEAYERLAPEFNYTTRKASAVPWDSVPENNRRLMIAVCAEIAREALKPAKTPGGCAVGPY